MRVRGTGNFISDPEDWATVPTRTHGASCMVCGRNDRPRGVWHALQPDAYVCTLCRDAGQAAARAASSTKEDGR